MIMDLEDELSSMLLGHGVFAIENKVGPTNQCVAGVA